MTRATNALMQELRSLRPQDPPQDMIPDYGYPGVHLITTAGHGYLAVPTGHRYYRIAEKICDYGYYGKHAIYLEEDVEARDFIKQAHDYDRKQ